MVKKIDYKLIKISDLYKYLLENWIAGLKGLEAEP